MRANESANPFTEHILTPAELLSHDFLSFSLYLSLSLRFSFSVQGASADVSIRHERSKGDRHDRATDRSYQFLRVITRVGHTEGPQRVVSGHGVSGLNTDIATKGEKRRRRRRKRRRRRRETPCLRGEKSTRLNRQGDIYGRSD